MATSAHTCAAPTAESRATSACTGCSGTAGQGRDAARAPAARARRRWRHGAAHLERDDDHQNALLPIIQQRLHVAPARADQHHHLRRRGGYVSPTAPHSHAHPEHY